MPVGYSGHSGGAGPEVWDYPAVAVTGRGGSSRRDARCAKTQKRAPGNASIREQERTQWRGENRKVDGRKSRV